MVTVPKYEPNVADRPIFQQGITVRATPDDMGAAIGRGMQGLAQGVSQVGQAFQAVQEMEDVARAKEADNQYAAWLREAQYGEGGFLTLEGRNAVDARAGWERMIQEKRREFGQGLTPGAQRAYDQASNSRVQSTLNSSVIHTANARKQWFNEASTARIDTFAEDALAAWNDPKKVEFNIAAGQAELRQQAEMAGWDADTLANREKQYISDVRNNVALRIAQSDPLAAQEYIEKHADQLTGPARLSLGDALRVPLLAAQANRLADEIYSGAVGAVTAAPAISGDTPSSDAVAPPTDGPRRNYMDVARSMIDMTEGRDYDAIASFIRKSAGIEIDPRSTAWCAAFVNAVLGANGIEGNGKLNARSFLSYGSPTDSPSVGDIVVLSRGDPKGWQGHVGFFAGYDANGNVRVVGGNQGNAVSEASFKASSVLGFRKVTQRSGAGGNLPTQNPGGLAFIEQQLQGITDPKLRDATRAELSRRVEAQEKAAKAERELIQTNVERYMIANPGTSPQSLPVEVQQALGVDGMTTLMNWNDKVSAQGEPDTDERILYELQTLYATDPAEFAQQDLFQFRDRLSNDDWATVTGWRQTALTDKRKASEEGLVLSTAFSSASKALEGVGITTVGLDGDKRTAAARRIDQFNNALARQMEEFKRQNERNPNELEIQSLVNRLLLPIVIKTPGAEPQPGLLTGWNAGLTLGGAMEQAGFLFEAGTRGDGTTVDVVVKYEDIPADLRWSISTDLERELGRKPSEDEVTARYEELVLTR